MGRGALRRRASGPRSSSRCACGTSRRCGGGSSSSAGTTRRSGSCCSSRTRGTTGACSRSSRRCSPTCRGCGRLRVAEALASRAASADRAAARLAAVASSATGRSARPRPRRRRRAARDSAMAPEVSITRVARAEAIDEVRLRGDSRFRVGAATSARAPARDGRTARSRAATSRIAGDEPDLVAELGEAAFDELDRLDDDRRRAVALARRPSRRGSRAGPPDGRSPRGGASASGSANTMRPSAARSSEPSARRTPGPNASTIAGQRRRCPAR